MLSVWKTGTFISSAPYIHTFKYRNGSYYYLERVVHERDCEEPVFEL